MAPILISTDQTRHLPLHPPNLLCKQGKKHSKTMFYTHHGRLFSCRLTNYCGRQTLESLVISLASLNHPQTFPTSCCPIPYPLFNWFSLYLRFVSAFSILPFPYVYTLLVYLLILTPFAISYPRSIYDWLCIYLYYYVTYIATGSNCQQDGWRFHRYITEWLTRTQFTTKSSLSLLLSLIPCKVVYIP